MPITAVVKDINIQCKNNSHKGRGARVTIPAVFRKKVYTPLKKNIHRNGESVEGKLTPVKRKLLQNSNTQTMLRIFKQYTDEPPGLVGGVRTVLVRGGHLGLDGARVKQLQQGSVLDRLVVPSATLNSELHPCK